MQHLLSLLSVQLRHNLCVLDLSSIQERIKLQKKTRAVVDKRQTQTAMGSLVTGWSPYRTCLHPPNPLGTISGQQERCWMLKIISFMRLSVETSCHVAKVLFKKRTMRR